jgi:glycosyltransferase involved in cell wall biosynthesis
MQSMANTTIDPALGGFEAVEPVGSTQREELRVLEVIPGNGHGAAFVFARRQVASLAEAGVTVRSFYLARGWQPQVLLQEWKRLRRAITEFRPALVHAHYGSLTALLCAAASTVPLIITLRGCDLNEDPEVNPIHIGLAHLFSHIACLRAKRVILVSEQLRYRLLCHRRDAVVIPTGVDLRVFRPIAQEQARKVLGWPQDIRIVLFHGGSRPRLKGADIVEPAVRAAEQMTGPIRLVDLTGDVPCERVPYWINAADCIALASVSEGSPNIVKEALACNVPVVTTDVGDTVERLQNVEPSRVVRRNVTDFAEALASILRQRRRSNGREKVSALDEPCIAQAVREVYESALEKKVRA